MDIYLEKLQNMINLQKKTLKVLSELQLIKKLVLQLKQVKYLRLLASKRVSVKTFAT